MKKFLVGAAAAAAILAPVAASADTTAVVGIQYSNTDIDSFDFDAYGINGAFNHGFSNGTYVQMDVAADRIDAGGCCLDSSYAAVHYGMRNDNYAFGGFVSLDELFIYSGLGIGLEGQWYTPNMVFNGSVANYDFSDLDASTTSVTLDGSYFFTPDFSVTGRATFADDELYGDDVTVWGLGGEYRFSGQPFSIELGYRQADAFDNDITSWTIGFNIDLGADSLYDRATSGPSQSGASYGHQLFTLSPSL
jgi:hypothetical protein